MPRRAMPVGLVLVALCTAPAIAAPQLFGRVYGLGPGSLTWNGGILFGLTPATPIATLCRQLEYEVHF